MNNEIINSINEELELEISLLQEEEDDDIVMFDEAIDDPSIDILEYDEEFDKDEADANGKFWEEFRKSRKNTVVQNPTKQQIVN